VAAAVCVLILPRLTQSWMVRRFEQPAEERVTFRDCYKAEQVAEHMALSSNSTAPQVRAGFNASLANTVGNEGNITVVDSAIALLESSACGEEAKTREEAAMSSWSRSTWQATKSLSQSLWVNIGKPRTTASKAATRRLLSNS